MAQLAPIATLVGTGASLYGTVRQGQAQAAQAKAQQQQEAANLAARQQQLAAAQQADARGRQDQLDRTMASTRARLAASGVNPDQGSAGAITAGLQQDAAEAAVTSGDTYAARMAAGRSSLLNSDGSLTTWLRAGNSFGGAIRSLLD
jgi:cell division protein FtsB